MQREHIVKLMAARKPGSANGLQKVLRMMMQHAIETGLRADDPTRDIRAIIVKTDGHHSWTESEIEQFEERHAIGSSMPSGTRTCRAVRRTPTSPS